MNSTSSNNKLQGKVAIITGGASSMGEATSGRATLEPNRGLWPPQNIWKKN